MGQSVQTMSDQTILPERRRRRLGDAWCSLTSPIVRHVPVNPDQVSFLRDVAVLDGGCGRGVPDGDVGYSFSITREAGR